MACLLPGVVGVVSLFIQRYQLGRSLIENETRQTARAILQAIDQDVAGLQGKLQILGLSPALKSNNLTGFYRQAKEVLATETLATAIVLIDQTGQQVMNTLLPFLRRTSANRAPCPCASDFPDRPCGSVRYVH